MSFRLTKQEAERRSDIVQRLSDAYAKIEDAVSIFNDGVEALKEPVQTAIEKYNEIVSEAQGFAEDIASVAENDYDEKSEKWQDGERGQAAQEYKSEWENLDFSEIEIDFPDELSVDDPEHASALEQAPEELAA